VYGGNEIAREQVNYFIKSVCAKLVREAKEQGTVLTVLILAHPSQSGKASGEGFSGSTAWNNAVRARLYLTRPDREGSTPDQRVLSKAKSNYSQTGGGDEINLIWDRGVFRVLERPDEALNHRVIERIGTLVHEAWEAGKPFTPHKASAFNLHRNMLDILAGEFDRGAILAAIQTMVEEELIAKRKSNSMYGYDTTPFEIKPAGRPRKNQGQDSERGNE
jgi:RecA-family ATPase